MKVIWRSNKSSETGTKNIGYSSSYDLNKTSQNVLAKAKGYRHHILGQTNQPKNKSSDDKACIVPRPESGDSLKPCCRLCGRGDELRSLETCDQLLQDCFGIKVPDLSAKICSNCTDLILHTQKFRDMVSAAFQPLSETSSLQTAASLLSIAKLQLQNYKSESEDTIIRNTSNVKRKAKTETAKQSTKKKIAVCSICKQKYSMPTATGDFVCSRCKIRKADEMTTTCVKCRATVPTALMKEHLEIHAKANLKGRCRLRSLTKNPSKAQTTDCVSKKSNQQPEVKCSHCFKQFTSAQRLDEHLKFSHGDFNQTFCQICGKNVISPAYLERHMKTHATAKTFECRFCGRIFKNSSAMQRHSTVRHGEQIF